MSIIDTLASTRIVAILRGRSSEHLDAVIDALLDGGVRAIEVTVPTPGSLGAIRRAVRRNGAGALVGAGTVLTADEAERAAAAGARFIVTPNTDPEVIRHSRGLGLEVLPGGLTPSEIVTAYRAGAAAVKIFPARAVGPAYFRDLAAPLPEIPLVAVGGVAISEIAAYVAAGAVAVGLGSPLIGDALDGGSLVALRERVAEAHSGLDVPVRAGT